MADAIRGVFFDATGESEERGTNFLLRRLTGAIFSTMRRVLEGEPANIHQVKHIMY
jgi:hypothetical protein